MNVNFTNKCNNHCPYCFQEENNINIKEMDFEDYKKVISWSFDELTLIPRVIFLGGEPTLYPGLKKCIDYYLHKFPNSDSKVQIITNFLGLDANIDYIIQNPSFKLLINSTYDEDKKNLFYRNINRLKNHNDICLSVTLTPNKKLNEKYILRLKDISDNFPFIKFLRIGLMTPKSSDNLEEIYNYDEDLKYLFKILKDSNFKAYGFDCAINFCQISFKYYLELIKQKEIKIENLRTEFCTMPINDITPTMGTKYCSSSSDEFIIDNIFKFSNSLELKEYYKKMAKNYKIQNKKCKKCELFKKGICHPCHSFDQALLRGERIKKAIEHNKKLYKIKNILTK